MVTLTVENYIKAIYQLGLKNHGKAVSTGQLAQSLDVSPGTVTSMLKTLSEGGLATYVPYEGVSLSASGTALALRILRRHRLIELFLVQTLGLTWDEVHEEAEHMEHAVSDRLVDRIDDYLGNPAVDPHGDPIPTADGDVPSAAGRPLASCVPGYLFRLTRVLDQSPEFLRYLTESGLALGTIGTVTANREQAGIVSVQVDSTHTTLGREAAEKIIVCDEVIE